MPLIAMQGKMTAPITVSTTAVVLMSSLSLNAEQNNALAGCEVAVNTNSIYIRYDGVNDISSAGELIPAGTVFKIGNRADCLRFIMWRATGSDATVVVTPKVWQ